VADQHTPADPTSQHPTELPAEQIEHPGRTGDMTARPDHGEQTYRGSGRLTGKRALITGGDSGIGRAVAIAFAREGADVLIVHLPEEQADGQETVRLVEQAGARASRSPGTCATSSSAAAWSSGPWPSSAASTCSSTTRPTR